MLIVEMGNYGTGGRAGSHRGMHRLLEYDDPRFVRPDLINRLNLEDYH